MFYASCNTQRKYWQLLLVYHMAADEKIKKQINPCFG